LEHLAKISQTTQTDLQKLKYQIRFSQNLTDFSQVSYTEAYSHNLLLIYYISHKYIKYRYL